jgi:type I restriction enzyme S subunit
VPYCECSDEEVGKYLLESGDIVFARTGATTGKSFLITNPPKAVFASYLIRLRLQEGINKKYFSYFLDSPNYWSQIMQVRKGSAQPGVNAAILAKLKVPVSPLPEQERIIAKIEELFTQLEAGTSALERVRAGLRRYKASVLKAAVEGRLVNGNLVIGEGGLPEGWRWTKVSEIAEVRLGRQRSPARAQGPNMRQYMRAANVTWNGIDLSDVKEMDFSPREQETYRLRYGDILLSEASGSISEVGKPAIWKEQLAESYIQNTLIRVRPFQDSSEYLYYHFLYDALAERFRKIAKGVGIHHLGAENLSNWIVSLPPLEEQHRIVAEVERRLSVARQVESSVEEALVRASRLRQAVLRSAFEGKLV